MTEADWLTSTDPQAMLTFLRDSGKLSDRKARLFTCARYRRVWDKLTDPGSRRVVEVVERHADGHATDAEVRAAVRQGRGQVWYPGLAARGKERAVLAALLRDIIGDPFRPPSPVPPAVLAWHAGTVVRLARAAYEERELPSGHLDPQRLAVLSDALEEAGADAELVAHLRDPGPHVRGCHVIDALLAKE